MHRSLTTFALAASGLFVSVSTATAQNTITVCASGCQYTSINAAIDDAEDGDIIQLSAETYMESARIDPGNLGITIRGMTHDNGSPASILDGSALETDDPIIKLSSFKNLPISVTLENLLVQNGDSHEGAGLHCDNVDATVDNCTFMNNLATTGGALSLGHCNPIFTNCRFEENRANAGGAVFSQGGNSTFDGCVFKQNVAEYIFAPADGGGLYISGGGTLVLTDCVVCGNTVDGVAADDNQILGDFSEPDSDNCIYADCANCYSECPADLNQDDVVDGADIAYVLGYWGTTDKRGDVNQDGMVDSSDIGILFSAWGPCPTP